MGSLPTARHVDPTLGISVDVPVGWSVAQTKDFDVVFLAPPDKGYRTNLGFSSAAFDPPTPEGLDAMLEATRQAQVRRYNGFSELADERVVIDDRPAWIQRYVWTAADGGFEFSQILALLVTGPGRLIQADGATRRDLEPVYLPVLRDMVGSVRRVTVKGGISSP